ncbi:hypothetical protein M427DRAFT_137368 [Gonapodya prolifera JEL478]|uniref:Uncharacterized protein n=1 Tax=Gonapodya prolifera (strain JEL478) TaxID=1344416 RepID=A0A139A772_GONPJ|nr:hypothetical protein M427DRAFT_137368 [Gonapodya prolifera JEL478]|eukprot:KXS12305.1 hypothetical protein M427DRAFT_137368 [Gonapodya prolifera JEL478]
MNIARREDASVGDPGDDSGGFAGAKFIVGIPDAAIEGRTTATWTCPVSASAWSDVTSTCC